MKTSPYAVELAGDGIWPADDWQLALDACGSEERARWLVDNAIPGGRVSLTPDALILAHAAGRLLGLGPDGEQLVTAPT